MNIPWNGLFIDQKIIVSTISFQCISYFHPCIWSLHMWYRWLICWTKICIYFECTFLSFQSVFPTSSCFLLDFWIRCTKRSIFLLDSSTSNHIDRTCNLFSMIQFFQLPSFGFHPDQQSSKHSDIFPWWMTQSYNEDHFPFRWHHSIWVCNNPFSVSMAEPLLWPIFWILSQKAI